MGIKIEYPLWVQEWLDEANTRLDAITLQLTAKREESETFLERLGYKLAPFIGKIPDIAMGIDEYIMAHEPENQDALNYSASIKTEVIRQRSSMNRGVRKVGRIAYTGKVTQETYTHLLPSLENEVDRFAARLLIDAKALRSSLKTLSKMEEAELKTLRIGTRFHFLMAKTEIYRQRMKGRIVDAEALLRSLAGYV